MTEGLDLSDAVPGESITLNLLHPKTKKETGWLVELAGPQHPAAVAVFDEIARENIVKARKIEIAQVNGKEYLPDEIPLDARRRRNVARVCRRILKWTPNPVFKNVSPDPIVFSIDAATDLFLRQDMAAWFLQITEYINGEGAFIAPSGTT